MVLILILILNYEKVVRVLFSNDIQWPRTQLKRWNCIIQSTLALRTPRYYGQPDNTDSSEIPGKNRVQAFD